MLTSALLTHALLTPPGTPPPPPFAPTHAEVTYDTDTLEILALDADGELVGALLLTPADDHVQLDASFPDGHVSVALEFGPPDLRESNARTDLPPDVAAARLSAMLAFVAPPAEGPMEHTSAKQCMYIFAGVAGVCGLTAVVTPLNLFGAMACVSGFATSLCACAEHIPLKVC